MSNIFTEEQMNRLEEGDLFTSWKSLCEKAKIPYKQGGRNQSFQKLELNRFFEYEQEKRSYRLLAKREIPLLKMTGTKSPYRKILQLLILDLVASAKDDKLSILQDDLFYLLSMVNGNFKKYRNSDNMSDLSTELDIPKNTIGLFYNRHSSRFRDIIHGTLNSLESQFLLTWDRTIRVMKNDTTSRKLTDTERHILITCKSSVAEHMKFNSENEIYLSGKYPEFMRKVVFEFNSRTECNARFFYYTYDIMYNQDDRFIDKKKRKMYDVLKKEYKIELQNDINCAIVDNILENVKNRSELIYDLGIQHSAIKYETTLADVLIKT